MENKVLSAGSQLLIIDPATENYYIQTYKIESIVGLPIEVVRIASDRLLKENIYYAYDIAFEYKDKDLLKRINTINMDGVPYPVLTNADIDIIRYYLSLPGININKYIYELAAKGNVEDIKELISPQYADTYLIEAAKYDNLEVVKHIFETYPTIEMNYKSTALLHCNKLETFKYLFENGVAFLILEDYSYEYQNREDDVFKYMYTRELLTRRDIYELILQQRIEVVKYLYENDYPFNQLDFAEDFEDIGRFSEDQWPIIEYLYENKAVNDKFVKHYLINVSDLGLNRKIVKIITSLEFSKKEIDKNKNNTVIKYYVGFFKNRESKYQIKCNKYRKMIDVINYLKAL